MERVVMDQQHPRVSLDAWRNAFADDSGARFAGIVDPQAALVASVLAERLVGRDVVWKTLRLFASAYDSLEFVHETRTVDRIYLEWNAKAFGLDIGGLTALTLNQTGRIRLIALHHRPLEVVTRFADYLIRRGVNKVA
jgi:hypothetical protein